MKITKKQVIKAIFEENLKAGSFFYKVTNLQSFQSCPVCAVGAVLRQTHSIEELSKEFINSDLYHKLYNLGTTTDLDISGLERQCVRLIDSGYYLSALSSAFEHLMFNYSVEDTRLFLLDLVEGYFPASFSFDLQDGKLA